MGTVPTTEREMDLEHAVAGVLHQIAAAFHVMMVNQRLTRADLFKAFADADVSLDPADLFKTFADAGVSLDPEHFEQLLSANPKAVGLTVRELAEIAWVLGFTWDLNLKKMPMVPVEAEPGDKAA
mgnify:FL=1